MSTPSPSHAHDEDLDRLVDVLLEEALGGRTPPDLAPRILAALPQTGHGIARRRWRVAAGLALAAVVVLAVGAWLLWPRYPGPGITGPYRLVSGAALERGCVLASLDRSVELRLGGYARAALAPDSEVAWAGAPRAEVVELRRGEIHCRVEPRRGAFQVVTELGTVSVTGTEFTVRIGEARGDTTMIGRRMWVKVLVGSVLLATASDTFTLAAGEEKQVGASGVMTGVVTEKGDNWFRIKDDAGKTERFMPRWIGGLPKDGGGLDQDILAQIRKLEVGTRVRVEWVTDERPRAVKIDLLAEPAQGGTVTGVIAEKGETWVRLKYDSGQTERFNVRWIGGAPKDGGGPDKDMVRKLAEFKAGDKVRLEWVLAEGKRIVAIAKAQ